MESTTLRKIFLADLREVTDDLEAEEDEEEELWVFGYGSILWKTGFYYKSTRIGYIDGHVRRFWQGSIRHRGTPQSPGRVATLVPCEEGRVWGVAYQLKGTAMISQALDHLAIRECKDGGYIASMLSFTCTDNASHSCPSSLSCLLPSSTSTSTSNAYSSSVFISDPRSLENDRERRNMSSTIRVLAFTALVDNALYLGPIDVDSLADDVISSSGSAGHNVEYVVRLAEYVRDNLPEDDDQHLFDLDRKIRENLNLRGLNVENVIASYSPVISCHVSHVNRRSSTQG